MAKPVLIGDRHFPTRTAAGDACRQVLYRHQPGQPIDAADAGFLTDLLRLHPEAAIKIGAGVSRFEVRANPLYGGVGFWVVRVDGTATDFSFNQCLRPSDHRQRALHAMRVSIADQIIAWRDRHFAAGPVNCALTGVPVTAPACHVDHAEPTFLELAERFAATEGGWASVEVSTSPEATIGPRLTRPDQQDRWQAHHDRVASLRIVTPRANLRRAQDFAARAMRSPTTSNDQQRRSRPAVGRPPASSPARTACWSAVADIQRRLSGRGPCTPRRRRRPHRA
jgi:hypothetical protein